MVERRASILLLGVVLSLAATALAARPSNDAQPPVDQRHIAQLVRQMGDVSYAVRERATRELARIGVPAKAALVKALADPDAEVRYRARMVLSEVLELDWRRRLEAFVDDTQGQKQHDLPGWQRYRKMMGENVSARRLFADMQRNEPGLLEASELGPERLAAAFDGRCQQIQESMRVPGRTTERAVQLGTVAALLFVGGDSDVPISPQSAMAVTNFCYQQPFRQAIAGGDKNPILKKLLGAWVRRSFTNDPSSMQQTMMLALQFNLREGIEPALAMLKEPGSPPHMRQYAVLVVGKFGGADDVARLEPLLSDQSVCGHQQLAANQVVETQVRDVALAVMVHLSGQKLADFGFKRAQPNATILFNTATLGFASTAERDAALAKWQQWRTRQAAKKS
ncbi:MAG: hypothetical protein HYX69_04105 [Planctomycetia bacterium]|nr:hypothetical protein [Planctomycetia bacterium]